MTIDARKAPFPWFGGKSKAAPLVWQLLGGGTHYVEPFAGSMAVLLGRPHPCNRPYYSETVNDLDGFLVNAWRAIQWHPAEVAAAASWPVAEADKTARQIACLKWRTDKTLDLLAGTAEWCDPKIAGWWLYGVCCQIGAFSGGGPWTVDPRTGRIHKQAPGPREPGVKRDRPHLGNNGQGVNRPQLREPGVSRDRPHLTGNGQGVNTAAVREPGVSRDLPHVSDDGRGVNTAAVREPGVSRNLPHLGNDGRGVNTAAAREPGVMSNNPGNPFHQLTMPRLITWMQALSARLRHVRIINGDWRRVCTTGAAHTIPVRSGDGPAGVFLDPPYDSSIRSGGLYSGDADNGDVAGECAQWAAGVADNPKWRIVLAGYDTEHDWLTDYGWTAHEWFTPGYLTGGMANTNTGGGTHQQHRERLWASPHCLRPDLPAAQLDLFAT